MVLQRRLLSKLGIVKPKLLSSRISGRNFIDKTPNQNLAMIIFQVMVAYLFRNATTFEKLEKKLN